LTELVEEQSILYPTTLIFGVFREVRGFHSVQNSGAPHHLEEVNSADTVSGYEPVGCQPTSGSGYPIPVANPALRAVDGIPSEFEFGHHRLKIGRVDEVIIR